MKLNQLQRKKASLSLSVNAIVILVMAITMLGLGLGFIRDKFGAAGNLIDDVQDRVKDSIIEDFATGNAKLSFPKSTFDVDPNGEYIAAMGFKNTEDQERYFIVELYAMNAATATATGATGSPPEALIESENDAIVSFLYISKYPEVDVNDFRIVPIKIQANGATPGETLFVRFEMCIDYDENGECGGSDIVYAQKEFFIEVR